jgi:hypothetical protein
MYREEHPQSGEAIKEKVIMYDSQEAATYRKDIEGWVSADGFYCGNGEAGERSARYRGATHTKCECCGAVIKMRTYTVCDECRHKKAVERYNALPFREYDGSLVVDWNGDTYFPCEEDIQGYLENNELESVDLLFCDENEWMSIQPDYWSDIMPEDSDGELPKELQEALDNLNKVISELPPCSYSPSKIRTSYRIKK